MVGTHIRRYAAEAASVLLQKYLYGKEQLATIVEARNTAAEALLHGLLEEQAYRLMRRRAFTNDYRRLHDFLLSRQKTDPTYGQAFCQLITRWNESVA